MDIQETRRANLMRWLENHTTPAREKSLFSQLKGTGSFGERVARRLEADYAMGEGFLDQPVESAESNRQQNRPPALSQDAMQLIAWIQRLDAQGPKAHEVFRNVANILALAHHGALAQNKLPIQTLIEEENTLRAIAYPSPETVKKYATRKRTAKQSG